MRDSLLQASQQASEPLLTSLLHQGLDLMVFGMGTVFIFLALLVAVTVLVSVVIVYFFPDDLISESSRAAVSALEVKSGTEEEVLKYHGKLERHQLLKILQKAVDQYRRDH